VIVTNGGGGGAGSFSRVLTVVAVPVGAYYYLTWRGYRHPPRTVSFPGGSERHPALRRARAVSGHVAGAPTTSTDLCVLPEPAPRSDQEVAGGWAGCTDGRVLSVRGEGRVVSN
jgi:hypothetical protein